MSHFPCVHIISQILTKSFFQSKMEMPPLNGVKSNLSYHNLVELPKIHVLTMC
jgi:hypothetical protein